MTPYTEISLGYQASADYIRQCFDCDDRMPGLVAAEFDNIADEHGVAAALNVHTSSVTLSVDELSKFPNDEPVGLRLEEWFHEAVERMEKRWMNDEL